MNYGHEVVKEARELLLSDFSNLTNLILNGNSLKEALIFCILCIEAYQLY